MNACSRWIFDVIQAEDPPGFIVRTEAHKAAAANGFRLERGIDGGWLSFGSTTAQVGIWIAGVSKDGPWLLAVDRAEVCAEFNLPPAEGSSGPGVATFVFDTLRALYGALDRIYRLGISLPDAPFQAFQAAIHDLPRTTEAERLVVQRIGQDLFRQALLAYWGGRCPMTGITNTELLRASHIVPWAECESDQKRLDVHNGLLLSALWDAAFDAGLVSFGDDGAPITSSRLSEAAVAAFGLHFGGKLSGLTGAHRANLTWHRSRYGFIWRP
jgi:HNH endonuclease